MKNKHANARVRLMVFRGDGGVFDPVNHHPNICYPDTGITRSKLSLNENGLDIGIYRCN
jgi:branched-chain amino acid aminotransferase